MLTFAAQTEVIMRDLRMEPRKLPKDLWKCFRKFSLARTPHEQRMHLFNQSAVVGLANISKPFPLKFVRDFLWSSSTNGLSDRVKGDLL